VSKYEPAVGDTGVVGVLTVISSNALVRCGFFDAAVTANGYASVAQNIRGAATRLECPFVPEGLNSGDWVTASILQGNYAPYAFNLTAL
jgi:hypothetical protein